jgi:hypothetical protein
MEDGLVRTIRTLESSGRVARNTRLSRCDIEGNRVKDDTVVAV